MATLDDILAASKVLAENSGNRNGESCSDVKKDDGNAVAADSTERIAEGKTVVVSALDSNNILGKIEKEKVVVGNLSSLSAGGIAELDNRVDDKDGEDSCMDNGGSRGNDADKLDVTERKSSYADGDGSEKGQVNAEHGFNVGDLVWGKFKSHTWWPGYVYGPTDASDVAMTRKQEGHLLVAFFGEGSRSWCLPSQLKPFLENFNEMSLGSTSKSFINAVEKAVNEISRLVESKMTCGCVKLEKRGVLAPDVKIRQLSVPEPAGILDRVAEFAKAVNIDNVFEVAVLRSWLSAFYRSKGVYPLPVYCEPFNIEGMEDKNKIVSEVTDDFSVPIEVPILGPLDDDVVSSPTCNSTKPHAPSGDKTYHRRKQKSVAELMGENLNDKPLNQEEKKDAGKKKKKKKPNDGEVDESNNIGESSMGRLGRKRQVDVSESPKIATKKASNTESSGSGDDVNKGTTSSGKSKKIEVVVNENTCETKEETETVSTPRERKKSKYLSPPYTNPGWRIGNSSFKMGTDKVPNTTEASEDPCAFASVSKSVDNEEVTDAHEEGFDSSVQESQQTQENNEKTTIDASDVNLPVDELISDIQSAALDPWYLSNEGCLDTVWSFVSALRSSIYVHGSNYKKQQKSKTGSKRKSRQGNQENNLSKVEPVEKGVSEEKKTERKPNPSKSKKGNEILDGNALSCVVLKFAPEYPLPSKEDIMRLFRKYGSLVERETHVIADSHSVHVVYTKDSDAEAAFKSSVRESPFGGNNVVNYQLQESSGVSKSHPNVTSHKRAHEKSNSSQPTSDDLLTDVRVIRQKLDIMTAILENYHLKFSSEDKSGLRNEMKSLLENVETASDKVRILAENSPS